MSFTLSECQPCRLPQVVCNTAESIDQRLEGIPPTLLVGTGALAAFAFKQLAVTFQRRWGESWRDYAGRWALTIPSIQKKYREEVAKQAKVFQCEAKERYSDYFTGHGVLGEIGTEIPRKGWPDSEIVAFLKKLAEEAGGNLKKHYSGTIYVAQDIQKSLEVLDKALKKAAKSPKETLALRLEEFSTLAFRISRLWNSLHGEEFPLAKAIEMQVVWMIADMFGGKPKEVMGFVTSGGTESLMLAMRAYRNAGIAEKGHAPGQGVILAPKSVHAAIEKAAQAYQLKVIYVETNEAGEVDMDDLESKAKQYEKDLITIVGSTPSYPTGVIDPIKEMAEIAQKYKCGMHVDCCLGGFVVNNLFPRDAQYLEIPGVTSLSADTHKNGLASKGSSVLVTKQYGEHNLAHYSIYTVPDWMGGLYGTPKDSGSQSAVPALDALVTLLAVGHAGYCEKAWSIQRKVQELYYLIEKEREFKILRYPRVNVIAWKFNKKSPLMEGAIYALADAMKKHGISINTIKGGIVHFCVTDRFAQDPQGIEKFSRALKEGLEDVKKQNRGLKRVGETFGGTARLYGSLANATTPTKKQGWGKYLENLLLGSRGIHDAVRSYVSAHMNFLYKGS